MTISAIISDDLTGAMDTGVQLVKKGLRVNVMFDTESISEEILHMDLAVVDTESRNVPCDAAYKVICDSVKNFEKSGVNLIYKKVDSTLRGNIGSELEAILDNCNFDMIVFVPALPFNGRVTVEGHHYVNGLKLTDTDLANDPFSPVKTSFIPDIIKQQSSAYVSIIDLGDIRRGRDWLLGKIYELHSQGIRIVVADSQIQQDMEILSDVLGRSAIRILPCGSAGLFSQMLKVLIKDTTAEPVERVKKAGPSLVISGSPAKATKLQIEEAERHGSKVVRLDVNKAEIDTTEWLSEVSRVKKEVFDILTHGENLIIDGAGKGKSELYEEFIGNTAKLLELSSTIQLALSDIFNFIIKHVKLAGVMIIGGDTAFSIAKSIGAKSFRIIGEVEPFIPAGLIVGGEADSLLIVTKAGGFGSKDIIEKTIYYLKGEKSNDL